MTILHKIMCILHKDWYSLKIFTKLKLDLISMSGWPVSYISLRVIILLLCFHVPFGLVHAQDSISAELIRLAENMNHNNFMLFKQQVANRKGIPNAKLYYDTSFMIAAKAAVDWAEVKGEPEEEIDARILLISILHQRLHMTMMIQEANKLMKIDAFWDDERSVDVLEYLRTAYMNVEYYDPIFEILDLLKTQKLKFVADFNANNYHGDLAYVHYKLHNYRKAYEEYKSFLNHSIEVENYLECASISNNIGLCFTHLDQTDSARFYFQKGVDWIDLLLSDTSNFKRAYFQHFRNVIVGNIEELKIRNGDLSVDKTVFFNQIRSATAQLEPHIASSSSYWLAYLYEAEGKLDSASRYCDSVWLFSPQSVGSDLTMKTYLLQMKILGGLGESEALRKKVAQFQEFSDSIGQKHALENYLTAATIMEVKETSERLEQSQYQMQMEQSRRQNQLIGFILLGILSVLLIILYYRTLQHKRTTESQQKEISLSLHEKEILLKEIHHRVKNNLNTVAGLFYMQSRKTNNPEFRRLVEDSQRQIQSIALVHQMFYKEKNVEFINLKDYIESLCTQITMSFTRSDVKFQIDVDPISLSIEKAVPLGLMLNELITNSFKHAFNEGSGRVTINIADKEDGTILLEYRDTGVGLPKDFVPENARTMGLRLINMIKDEINGELTYMRRKGFGVQLTFKQ